MSKKIFAVLLAVCGICAAVSAAEYIELIAFVNGADAKLAVEEKSENLRAGKLITIDYKTAKTHLQGKKMVFTVPLDENGKASMSLKLNTISDKFCSVRVKGLSGVGKKAVQIPVACTKLMVGKSQRIPLGKVKAKRIEGKDVTLVGEKYEGERTIEFSADFVKLAEKKEADAE